jgi:uncharacterized protein
MLMDVDTFRRRTEYELDGLVGDLRVQTARGSPAELKAWRNSLPALARVLSDPQLGGFHVHLGVRGNLLVEYRLPATANWADVVLLGAGESGPAAVVVELKDWDTRADLAGASDALIQRGSHAALHPSAQVQGYVEYCQRFHGAVQDYSATVNGCVYFTYASSVDPYRAPQYQELERQFPVFARNAADVEERFPAFLKARLKAPDPGFAEAFERGRYQQDRGFVRLISQAIKREPISPFVLLDSQRLGFELCKAKVLKVLKPATAQVRRTNRKSVVVIHGPPGSGKSVIAAHLWATFAGDERIDGNVVLATTSTAQRSNWEAMFERSVGKRSARGCVVGSTRFNPGVNQDWLKATRAAGKEATVKSWRENLASWAKLRRPSKCPDDSFAVSIVDEAHALIDPTVEGKEGISASGWMLHAGPQAWHVIRASRVSVFLLDPQQSYRDNETTTIARIREFAEEFDADFEAVSLEDSQFRCGGAPEYVRWLETVVLAKSTSVRSDSHRHIVRWRNVHGGPLVFDIVDNPRQLEDALRARVAEGRACRLLASYARPWSTKGMTAPHRSGESRQDFVIRWSDAKGDHTWTRIWNYAPDSDYSRFIQAPAGTEMSSDPLCEVGCPYVVRGFDFDYIGLLWLNDLVWRGDRWQVNLDRVHESAFRLTLGRARKGKPEAKEAVTDLLLRGYRILLSRAMRGTYVWFEDAETREHVQGLLDARAVS